MRRNVLCAKDGELVAQLAQSCRFETRGKAYVRLDIDGPLVVTLKVAGEGVETAMPCEWVSLAYGCLHCANGQLAVFDARTATWREPTTSICYREIVVAPC